MYDDYYYYEEQRKAQAKSDAALAGTFAAGICGGIGIVFSVFLNILFALNHYADIASQKTSAIMLTAGFLLMFNAIRRKRYRFMCLLGAIEILIGSLLHWRLRLFILLPTLLQKVNIKSNFISLCGISDLFSFYSFLLRL